MESRLQTKSLTKTSKAMKIAILNYPALDIDIVRVDDYEIDRIMDTEDLAWNEAVENYLTDSLGYHIDDISYMCADDDTHINIRQVNPTEEEIIKFI